MGFAFIILRWLVITLKHIFLKILIGFAFTICAQGLSGNWFLVVAALLPFLLVFVITFLEVAIAVLTWLEFLMFLMSVYFVLLFLGGWLSPSSIFSLKF